MLYMHFNRRTYYEAIIGLYSRVFHSTLYRYAVNSYYRMYVR
jgi:hypothetical protein